MALMVVFIHSAGQPPPFQVDIAAVHACPLSGQSFYYFLRVAGSCVATHVAVPLFFMVSGFLLFYGVGEWNNEVYVRKIKRRMRSLLVPYLLWITLYIAFVLSLRAYSAGSLEGLWQTFLDMGGFRTYWDTTVSGQGYYNWFGCTRPWTGPVLGPMWFVRDLFVLTLLSPAVCRLIRRFGKGYLLTVLFLYVSQLWVNVPGLSSTAIWWFSLGAYMSIEGKDIVAVMRRHAALCHVLAAAGACVLTWYGGRPGNALTQALYPVFVIFASASAVNVSSWLVETGRVAVYPLLARVSFFVFAAHCFFLVFTDRGFQWLSGSALLSSLYYLAVPFVIGLLCIVAYRAMDRLTPRLLGLLMGQRAKRSFAGNKE